MVGHHVDHSHNAAAASHAHVLLNAVGPATVNRYQVVGLVKGVGDHLGRYQLIVAEELQLLALGLRGVLCKLSVETAQLADLAFQIEVAQREFLVDACKREEVTNGRIPLIDLSHHDVG